MCPKRGKVDKRFTIPLNYIEKRIQFKNQLQLFGHDINIPEDRGRPKSNLQNDSHDLLNISHKYIQCRYDPSHAQGKDTHTKQIIYELKKEYDQQDIQCLLIEDVDVFHGIKEFAESYQVNLLSFTVQKRRGYATRVTSTIQVGKNETALTSFQQIISRRVTSVKRLLGELDSIGDGNRTR